ncbi:hypothetical protein ACVIIV_002522 [Bradyrhizobium sp. USDA 4354]
MQADLRHGDRFGCETGNYVRAHRFFQLERLRGLFTHSTREACPGGQRQRGQIENLRKLK